MASHANSRVALPRVVPHITARTRRHKVRLTIPAVCDLLLSPDEAIALADSLVDVAENLSLPDTERTPE